MIKKFNWKRKEFISNRLTMNEWVCFVFDRHIIDLLIHLPAIYYRQLLSPIIVEEKNLDAIDVLLRFLHDQIVQFEVSIFIRTKKKANFLLDSSKSFDWTNLLLHSWTSHINVPIKSINSTIFSRIRLLDYQWKYSIICRQVNERNIRSIDFPFD